MKNLPHSEGKDFNKFLKTSNPHAIDLVKKMLIFDPTKRITIQEALEHPFMANNHNEDDEPVEKEPVSAFDFDFELYSLKTDEIKQLMYEEIQLYHSEEAV